MGFGLTWDTLLRVLYCRFRSPRIRTVAARGQRDKSVLSQRLVDACSACVDSVQQGQRLDCSHVHKTFQKERGRLNLTTQGIKGDWSLKQPSIATTVINTLC